ncbi:hypothetical protein K493DRAFT_316850 [Basidiobolus meristosporus CBS 931.73]|uniref:SH3 domain-containing protein n=1 Tax=Basidiobolus meristosporus CBS 931.73 TaxID=1314790 RepID=A0A1Y1Y204_9FUNG|nr:hypothetical protein K493DRAFT_316850 [Basidiobolus meristosporus CBS 931.73]|eukprot:ORX92020.1 hypothetical protein K493DRAFT_316850 [Basidiobolus meristosporus CBS 931.73]
MKLYLHSLSVTALVLISTNISPLIAVNPTVRFSECASSYLYKGVQYQGCTEADNQGKPWCFLQRATVQDNWGYCQTDTVPLRVGSYNGQQVDCDVTSDAGNGTLVYGCFATSDKTFSCFSSKVNALVTCTGTKSDPSLPKKPLSANPSDSSVSSETSKEKVNNGGNPANGISTGVIGGVVAVVVVGVAGLAMLMYRRNQKKNAMMRLSHSHGMGLEPSMFEDAKMPPPHLQKTYTVVSTYTPTLGDELEIYPGDKVTVIVEYDDGWVQGINETRGRVKGVFPKHCVEEVSRCTSPEPTNL